MKCPIYRQIKSIKNLAVLHPVARSQFGRSGRCERGLCVSPSHELPSNARCVDTSSIFSAFEPHFTPWDLSTARPVLEPQIVALVCMLVAGNFDASSVAAWQKLFKNDFQTILEKKNWWKKFFCRTTVSLQTVLRRAVSPLKVSPHDSFTAVNLVVFWGSLSPADLI